MIIYFAKCVLKNQEKFLNEDLEMIIKEVSFTFPDVIFSNIKDGQFDYELRCDSLDEMRILKSALARDLDEKLHEFAKRVLFFSHQVEWPNERFPDVVVRIKASSK